MKRRLITVSLLSACALALPASRAAAQDASTGRITGTITGTESNQPIQGVRVTLLGTQLTVTSNPQGRYTIANFTKQSPGAYGLVAGGPSPFGFAGQSLVRNQSFALGWTFTLSPTLITDVRFGAFRYRVFVQPNGIGTTPATDPTEPVTSRLARVP